MELPNGITEEQFLNSVNKIVNILCPSFAFGFYTVEDIKQQARIFAMEAMLRYDVNRPLDNFLYTHIKNRLINFRRDNFRRNDPPCYDCHNSLDGQSRHADKRYCDKYRVWLKLNTRKQNVVNPLDIDNISDETESRTRLNTDVVEEVGVAELLSLIDMKLDISLRQIYLQMRAGESVPKAKRLAVEAAILDIVGDNLSCLY